MSVLPGGDWQVTPVVPDDSGSGPTPPLTLCGVLPFIVALAASAGVATTAAACDHQHASPVVWDAPNPDNTSAASNIRANRSANAGSVLAAGTGITQFGSDTTGVAIGAQGDYSSILGGDAGGIDSASSYAAIVAGTGATVTSSPRAFIGAGQSCVSTNSASAFLGAGSGGLVSAASDSFLGAGRNNIVRNNPRSAVVAGDANVVEGANSFVGAGFTNRVSGSGGGVLAGRNAIIDTSCDNSVVAGGNTNTITSNSLNSFVGAGTNHFIRANTSGIVAGTSNVVDTTCFSSVIGAGSANQITTYEGVSATYAAIGAGRSNVVKGTANDSGVFVGFTNVITNGARSAIAAGANNAITADRAFVGAGSQNSAQAADSAITNGLLNSTKGQYACVAGGATNLASNNSTFIGGGTDNTASGGQSCVVGGTGNSAAGKESAVIGGSGSIVSSQYGGVFAGDGATIEAACTGAVIAGGSANSILDDPAPGTKLLARSTLSRNLGANAGVITGSGYATIIGGDGSTITGSPCSSIIGGVNIASLFGVASSITGPGIAADFSTYSYGNLIAGADKGTIAGNATFVSSILGGYNATIGTAGNASVVGNSAIVSGSNNVMNNTQNSIICGGSSCTVGAVAVTASTTSGIFCAFSSNVGTSTSGVTRCVVVGGTSHGIQAGATNSVAVGGASNTITGATNAAVVGGASHAIASTATRAVVLGGSTNTTSAPDSAILGGLTGTIEAACTGAVIAGGSGNQIKNSASPVGRVAPNSRYCLVSGDRVSITGSDSSLATGVRSYITDSPFSAIFATNDLNGLVGASGITGQGYVSDFSKISFSNVIFGGNRLTISVSASADGVNSCLLGASFNSAITATLANSASQYCSIISAGSAALQNASQVSLIACDSCSAGSDSLASQTCYSAIIASVSTQIGTATSKSDRCFAAATSSSAIQASVRSALVGTLTSTLTSCSNSVAVGGSTNTISGATNAAVVGGSNNTVASTATSATVLGSIGANATQQTQVVRSGGYTASVGERQAYTLVLRGDTPGLVAGESVILKYGVAGGAPTQEITLVNGKSYTIRAEVNATQSGAANTSAAWFIQAIAYCTGGVVTVAASSTTNLPAALPGGLLGATIAFSGSGTTLRLTATIAGGTTLASKWTADVKVVETLA